MSIESLSSEDNVKLRHVIDTGVRTTQEITILREGLRDTIKAVATELQSEPREIRRSIRAAIKEDIDAQKAEVENIEMILSAVGRR
jgi:phage-related protein